MNYVTTIPKISSFLSLITFTVILIFPLTSNCQVCTYPNPTFETPTEIPTLCDINSDIFSSPNIQIGAGTPYPFSSLLGSVTLPKTIHIIGDFTVNSNFSFDRKVVKINNDVSIKVQNNLTLNNSSLFACDCLWEGIILETGSRIISKGSAIQDARKAIRAENKVGVFLVISDTSFDRNMVGISLTHDSPSPNAPIFFKFENNSFTTTSAINCTGDHYGNIGVELQNISQPFHTTISGNNDINTFNDLIYGVKVTGTSILRGHGWKFKSIKEDGIFLEKGSLHLTDSKFIDCEKNGIQIQEAQSINVLKGRIQWFDIVAPFSDYRNGIFIKNTSIGSNIEITQPIITGSFDEHNLVRGIAIGGGNIGAGTSILIEGGLFSLSSKGAIGVHLDGYFPPSASVGIGVSDFEINGITRTGSGFQWGRGIALENGDKSQIGVGYNIFSVKPVLDENPRAYGIHLRGNPAGSFNFFTDNTFNLGGLRGFYSRDSRGSTICNNTSGGFLFEFPFTFQGDNNDTDFSLNEMRGGASPTVNILSGFIGGQKHEGNKWEDRTIFTGAGSFVQRPGQVFNGSPFPELSQFIVHEEQSISNGTNPGYTFFSKYHPHDIEPNTPDFFEVDPAGIPTTSCFIRKSENWPDQITNLDNLISTGQFSALPFSSASIWEAEKYLYQKIKRDQLGIYSNVEFSSFISANDNSSIGNFYLVKKKINEGLSFDQETLNELDAFLSEIEATLIEIEANDIALENTYEQSEINALENNKIVLVSGLQEIQESIDSINNDYIEHRSILLNEANVLNSEIEIISNFELNEKKVNEIFIYSILNNGELTETQINELSILAQECPENAGWSVYTAIGLLPTCIRLSLNLCEPASDFLEGKSSVRHFDTPISIKPIIYPNPTESDISLNLPNGLTGDFVLYNITGKILSSKQNLSSDDTIDMSEFQQGIYILKGKLSDGTITTEKVILQ